MIFVKNTPNNTGVAIYGDYMDFENFYEALHAVVGDEDEFVGFEAARIRVLGICYDIRYALMGDREIEFVDNGMDEEKRLKNIPTMAKRLAEPGEEYKQIKAAVTAAARHYNTYKDNIKPPVDYPEDFEW